MASAGTRPRTKYLSRHHKLHAAGVWPSTVFATDTMALAHGRVRVVERRKACYVLQVKTLRHGGRLTQVHSTRYRRHAAARGVP